MAATVVLSETNGVGATVTDDIRNCAFGDTDAPNLFPLANYDISFGTNSYEKWIRLKVTSLGGSTSVSNLRVWITGELRSGDGIKTNARTSGYGGAATYTTPTTSTSTVATQTMPTAEPATANLGIGGSLSGSLTAAGYSDYLVMQLQTAAAAGAGTYRNLVLHVAYDEA